MPLPPPSRPRLLIVSATYVARENRKKLTALSAHFEVTALTCRRNRSSLAMEERGDDDDEATVTGQARPYRLVTRPSVGRPASTTKYLLAGLGRFLRREPAFDVVLVEAEPWALVRWQTWFWVKCWQRGARFGEFSWENVERPGWRGRVLGAIYRAAVASDDFVVAGNQDAGAIFRRYGADERNLLVSPQLGVDTNLFRPAEAAPTRRDSRRRELGLPAGAFLVGYAGRLTAAKGVRDLLAAVDVLRGDDAEAGQGPGAVHLALLGAGDLGEEFRAAARTRPWLHLLPPCPHAEVAEFLRSLDVFVLPSRGELVGGSVWREQFGHVLIEATACGVPTLGSIHGAIPEVLGEDPEALFPPGDVPALAARLGRWRREPKRTAALATRQRANTLARYSLETLAEVWAAHLVGSNVRHHSRCEVPVQTIRVTGL